MFAGCSIASATPDSRAGVIAGRRKCLGAIDAVGFAPPPVSQDRQVRDTPDVDLGQNVFTAR
jgi:hypothetical protein